MSYVDKNLGKNEVVIKKAKKNGLYLLGAWIKGILLCWLLFIPTVKAIIRTIQYFNCELAVTNKRIVGKVGVFNTKTLDSPLNKIQNVGNKQTFLGKIFNYTTVVVTTAACDYYFEGVKANINFKNTIMQQIDTYEEERIKQQATEMAKAIKD